MTSRVVQLRLQATYHNGKLQCTLTAAGPVVTGTAPSFPAAAIATKQEPIEFTLSVANGSGLVVVQSGEWPGGCGGTVETLLGSVGLAESDRLGLLYNPNETARAVAVPDRIEFTFSSAGILVGKSVNHTLLFDLKAIAKSGQCVYYVVLEVSPGATGQVTLTGAGVRRAKLPKSISA